MNPYGPPDAPIVILVDWPSRQDKVQGKPLSDWAGGQFFSIFSQIGMLRNNCQIYTLLENPPPNDDLSEYISKRKTCPGPGWEKEGNFWIHPHLLRARGAFRGSLRDTYSIILPVGDAAFWAVTGNLGIAKWRGSRLRIPGDDKRYCVPILNPRVLVKEPALRPLFQVDLKRAKAVYEGTQVPREYNFLIEPKRIEVIMRLTALLNLADSKQNQQLPPLNLSGDLETRGGHIACFGIAHSADSALCIPFLKGNSFYWSEEDEADIVFLISRLFLHDHIQWIGQNFLYDCQYFHRFWGCVPKNVYDTMIGAHSVYSNMRKGLDFLSSMYAQDHVYWKDEIKEWDPTIGERQYWTYNCKDACLTWEIWPEIVKVFMDENFGEHPWFQQDLFFPALRMMNRGIRIDTGQRQMLRQELVIASQDRQEKLNFVAGHELNPRSPAQLSKFFYSDLGIPGVKNLTGDSLTTNSPAMALIAEREPLLKPVCQLIVELRSIGVFLSTFIDAKLDSDGRMRCSFSVAGPTTYRLSSSENAFGSGMNLQNIPVMEKKKIQSDSYVKLPNIRKLFIPDPGFTFFDMDLDRADLQVVVWEADDAFLKKALNDDLDMHCLNACDIFDIKGIPYEELRETHPNYKDHRGRIGEANRGKSKAGVHATNYGVGDRKLAQTLGITQHEAARFRARWFGAHPGIKRWHLRTQDNVSRFGYIENKFGARLYNLGRFDLPEFLGWLPQSTVAKVINSIWIKIDELEQAGNSQIQLLLQVHDSLAGQFPTEVKEKELATLQETSKIVIPYDDPLIIPVGIKTSTRSWGDCK